MRESALEKMMERRRFLYSLTGGALAAGWRPDARVFETTGPEQGAPAPVIDGLGEIHLDYDDALLDEIRASGMCGCVVTVGNPALQGADAFGDMKTEVEAYDRHIAAHRTRLSRMVNVRDLDRARESGTIGLIYYTQNAAPLGDDVARLETLKGLGVRIIQLTYNTRNLLGDGCLERINSGLSKFGVEVVERMNTMRLLVDASHCGEATTMDAITFSKAPIAITHSGCKAVFDHPRNKTDATMRAMAQRGGAIGIFQINPYLGAKERNTLGDYITHIEHAVNVCGVEHVGIGSDREHRTIPDTAEEKQKLIDELSRLRPVTASTFRWPFFISDLNGPRRMEVIRRALEKRRMPADSIDKILGANWYRLFRDTL